MSKLATIEKNEIAEVATPATLLQMAVSQGADIDKLEKLMELQQRWEDNEARKAFTISMTDFRSACPSITKDKEGHQSKYASLAHTLSLIKKSLSEHGLSHNWKTNQSENGLISVTCCVTHKLGYQECTTMSASAETSGSKNPIQAIGSTITYLERYTLFAILGLASTDQDDDGAGSIEFVTDEQAANLQSLLEEVGADKAKFLKFFKSQSFDNIPANKFKQAIQMLESKRVKS